MKANSSVIDHFTDAARVYDERNRQLAPIADNMHFLIRLILKNAPMRARVLCVGVGTGAEILSLSKSFPEWTFVGVDPSTGMLDVYPSDRGRRKRVQRLRGGDHGMRSAEAYTQNIVIQGVPSGQVTGCRCLSSGAFVF